MDHNSDFSQLSKPDIDLRQDFPPAGQREWEAAAEKLLKRTLAEADITTMTPEGIELQPIYHAAAGRSAVPTSGEGGWLVAQALPFRNPAEQNRALRHDLARGQDCLNLQLDPVIRRRGTDNVDLPEQTGGVRLETGTDWGLLLEGIDLTTTPLYLQGYSAALPLTAYLLEHCGATGCKPEQLTGAIECDPVGELARSGSLPLSLSGAYREMQELCSWGMEHAPQLRTIAVHTEMYHNAGGNAVLELAFALATGVEYLRQLETLGLPPAQSAPRFLFSMAVGPHLYMELAKLRAFRMLWQQVVLQSGCQPHNCPPHLRGVTAEWNLTTTDPQVNILRLTTASMTGVLGGCDSLQTGFFDNSAGGPPGELARRLARNTQLILQQEAQLGQVADPAAGSHLIEELTSELCDRSWSLFQQIEQRGSMSDALQKGYPQELLLELARKRREEIERGDYRLVGTTIHLNDAETATDRPTELEETPVTTVPESDPPEQRATGEGLLDFSRAAVRAGASLTQLCGALWPEEKQVTVAPLQPLRELLQHLEVPS